MSDSEEVDFWATHSLSQELLEVAYEQDDEELPPKRKLYKLIKIQIDRYTLD